MMKRTFIQLCCGAALMVTAACTNQEDLVEAYKESFGTIQVGGLFVGDNITTSVTRADEGTTIGNGSTGTTTGPVAAESLDWLKTVLKGDGLVITYGNDFDNTTGVLNSSKKALLKYNETNGYTFTYAEGEDKDKEAEWMSNGFHVFEGLYYPEKLKGENITGGAENRMDIFENQSGDNYTALSQYTCMPLFPDSRIAATINQISLPFQHRLARVIVEVCIDPNLKTDYNDKNSKTAQIQGYELDNDGKLKDSKACTLRFCNVKVLGLVKEDKPEWYTWPSNTDFKVIPHFLEERTEVKVPTKRNENGEATEWATYNKVPTFDVIVRPTYRNQETLMPDERTTVTEENKKILDEDNHIAFTVTLDNGMVYTKDVQFDLNPNEQTTIQLVINKEGVNVNDAGTNNWVTDKFKQDDYYGIDNTLGHNLSKAGSCWQRAYQIGTPDYNVTDGSNPVGPDNKTELNTQYLTEEQFIAYLKEAKTDGAHHGDYFILTGPITLPSDWSPFEFTGHLDGRYYKLTVANSEKVLFSGLNGNYEAKEYEYNTKDKEGNEVTGKTTANIHTVNGTTYPLEGYRAEILNLYLETEGASLVSGVCTGYIYNCHIKGENSKFCETLTDPGQVVDCTKK